MLQYAFACFAKVVPQHSKDLIIRVGKVDFRGPTGNIAYDIELGLGYFVIDDLEIGPLAGFVDNGTNKGFGLGVFAEYNIDLGIALVPYVGVSISYLNGNLFIENAVQFEGGTGLKFFLAKNVAVSGEFVYDYATKNSYYNNDSWQNTDCGLNFVLRAFF